MLKITVCAVALFILAGCLVGCGKDNCPPNSPCWTYDYEFEPVVEDTVLYEGSPVVTLLDGRQAQIHALKQEFRNMHDGSIQGLIYSYVLRLLDYHDEVIMETIGVWVTRSSVSGDELTAALRTPAASRYERIASIRRVLETNFDMYYPRDHSLPAGHVVQPPPPEVVGGRLHCMMLAGFSDYNCPMPPP